LDSSAILVQTASGLQKTMSEQTGVILKDSTVAQISAAIYYQAKVVAKLTANKQFQNQFNKVLFNQISKDFSEYIDAQARVKPATLHHVYEWGKAGNKSARLFKLKNIQSEGLSFKIKNEFQLSKSMVPNPFGQSKYRFPNKASVMEAGMPVKIIPKTSKRLVFQSGGSTVFMPIGASVTVRRPGGGKATGRFQIAFAQFFTGQLVNSSIKNSGFQKLFNTSMSKAMQLPSDVKRVKYSFSANSLDMQAEAAIAAAFGGAL